MLQYRFYFISCLGLAQKEQAQEQWHFKFLEALKNVCILSFKCACDSKLFKTKCLSQLDQPLEFQLFLIIPKATHKLPTQAGSVYEKSREQFVS